MQELKRYRFGLGLLFFAILMVAYTGKFLHHHDDSYYGAYEQTGNEAGEESSLSDNCPICSFVFYYCLYAATQPLLFFVTLLCCCVCVAATICRNNGHYTSANRAPPVVK